ncbi:MAG: TonB-dependent receptor [Bacteroidota bacterium]
MKRKSHYLLFLFLFLCGTISYAQTTISGKVVDESGQGLPGVSIYEKGKETSGTSSGTDGNYSLQVSSDDATVVFSFTGMQQKEINIAGQTKFDITLEEEIQALEEVFVTATSKPIRKIEAVTAVEAITAKEIERMNPVSLADLVRFTPGLFVQTQAGRVRNFVFTRGFPDATSNGFIYTSLMMDGLRTFASPEMVPDGGFRNDLNVERVEIVRGSAATLYGRGAAAGAINVISRTGGEQTSGTVKMMVGNNNWYQLDANINGALNTSKSWRYNVGGFWLTDDGFRNNVFPDRGGQIRGNLDYLFDKGSLRISAGYINLNVYNNLSIPYVGNELEQPAGNWETTDAILQAGNPFEGASWPAPNPVTGETGDNTYDDDYRRGNFSQGFNVGSELNLDLGNGWSLSNKLKFQDMIVGIGFDFGINTNFGDTQTRIIFGGGTTNGGSDSRELIDELRINKSIVGENAEHNIVFGGYISRFNALVNSVGSFYSANTADADKVEINREPFGFPFNLNFRDGDYTENTASIFAGDEIKINDKFTLNLGVRYDAIELDLTDNYQAGQENLNNQQDHSGWNYSAGFNYLFDPLTAIYGNFTSSFRAPDYGTYTPVRFLADTTILDKPRVENNEDITSIEAGFRKSTEDWSLDFGVFNTIIANRVVPAFVGAIATQVPVGDNRITGAEVNFIYTPQSVSGLYIRTSLTYQNTAYTDFQRVVNGSTRDLTGNRIANVPPLIWNFSVGYDSDRFGININNNFVSGRPVDIYNTFDYPARSLMDANAYVNIVKGLRVKVGVQNLTNVTHAASVISAQTDDAYRLADANNYSGDFRHVRGIPYLPRRIFGSIEYRF